MKSVLERMKVAVAHGWMRKAVEPGIVRDEAHDSLALGVASNSAFCDTKESNVEVVETVAFGCRETWYRSAICR